jgi:hypothetical protein
MKHTKKINSYQFFKKLIIKIPENNPTFTEQSHSFSGRLMVFLCLTDR